MLDRCVCSVLQNSGVYVAGNKSWQDRYYPSAFNNPNVFLFFADTYVARRRYEAEATGS